MTRLEEFINTWQHWSDVVLTPVAWLSRKVWGADPPVPARDPFRLFVFATLGLLSILSTLGITPPSPALAAAPDGFTVAAGLCITGGSLMVAVALCLPGHQARLLVEQVGLMFAGFGLLCYGVAVIHNSGFERAQIPASFAFGASLGTGGTYVKLWWYQRKPWTPR